MGQHHFAKGQKWVFQNGAALFQNGADSKMGHNIYTQSSSIQGKS